MCNAVRPSLISWYILLPTIENYIKWLPYFFRCIRNVILLPIQLTILSWAKYLISASYMLTYFFTFCYNITADTQKSWHSVCVIHTICQVLAKVIFVSPELCSERDYMITYSVCSVYVVRIMYVVRQKKKKMLYWRNGLNTCRVGR